MGRFGVVLAFLLMWFGGAAMAADTRPATGRQVYDILQDGRRIGTHVMDIRREGDRTVVSYTTSFVVELMRVPFFAYERTSKEVWAGDRLVEMQGVSRYGGKKFTISVKPEAGGLRVKGRKHDWLAPSTAVPGSLWNPALVRTKTAFDAERGKKVEPVSTLLGREPLKLGSLPIMADRYHIEGFSEPIDIWYGPDGLFVKARLKFYGVTFEYVRRD